MPKLYPVMDSLAPNDYKALGLTKSPFFLPSSGVGVAGVMAVRTGEKRSPRKGEWYLSGAVVEAYRAPNDLATEFHIAKLVKTRTETKTVIVP